MGILPFCISSGTEVYSFGYLPYKWCHNLLLRYLHQVEVLIQYLSATAYSAFCCRQCSMFNNSFKCIHRNLNLVPFTGHRFMKIHNPIIALDGIYQWLTNATEYYYICIQYHYTFLWPARVIVYSYRNFMPTFIAVHGQSVWIGLIKCVKCSVLCDCTVPERVCLVTIFLLGYQLAFN